MENSTPKIVNAPENSEKNIFNPNTFPTPETCELTVGEQYKEMAEDILLRHSLQGKMTDSEIDQVAFEMVMARVDSRKESGEVVENENLGAVEKENTKELEKKPENMSVFSRGMEVFSEYLAVHPKLAKFALLGIVAAELAGNAQKVEANPNILNSIVYEVQRTAQEQSYYQQRTAQEAQYAKNLADQTYIHAMQINDEGANNALSRGANPDEVRMLHDAQVARIQAQYQQDIMQINQRVGDAQYQANNQLQSGVVNAGVNIIGQMVRGGGHYSYGRGGGLNQWYPR